MMRDEGPAVFVDLENQETARVVVDGRSYDAVALGKIVRLVHRIQFWEMRAILKEYCPGYEPFDRLQAYELVEEIDQGCRLVTEAKSLTLSRVFGLEFAWGRWREATPEGFRQQLRDRMQRLGDRIIEAWTEDQDGEGR